VFRVCRVFLRVSETAQVELKSEECKPLVRGVTQGGGPDPPPLDLTVRMLIKPSLPPAPGGAMQADSIKTRVESTYGFSA
jgi:hypothetical protein